MAKVRVKITSLFLALIFFFSSTVAPVFALISYSYDTNGNMVSDGQYCYVYNEANQVSKAINCSSGQVIAEYLYDFEGKRIVKKEYQNGSLKQTTYTPDKSFETIKLAADSSILNTSYYYVNDELVARKNSDGSKAFYSNDHLNSTNILTDAGGKLIEETTYYPYGEIRSGGTNSKYLYTGQEKDLETGLNYYGARYYNPHIARFTQPDSILPDPYDPQQLNRYAYTRNNPLKYTDPSGHNPLLAPLMLTLYGLSTQLAQLSSSELNFFAFNYATSKSQPQEKNSFPTFLFFDGAPIPINGSLGKSTSLTGGGTKAVVKGGEDIAKSSAKRGSNNPITNAAREYGMEAHSKSDFSGEGYFEKELYIKDPTIGKAVRLDHARSDAKSFIELKPDSSSGIKQGNKDIIEKQNFLINYFGEYWGGYLKTYDSPFKDIQ